MKEKSLKMNVLSVDELFTSQEERDYIKADKVEEIDINLIEDFPNHPFKVQNDDRMKDLAESVKKYGVFIPAIVRKKENGNYEMIAGHRRKLACSLAGKDKIPCIVKDLSDEEATILMVDTNLEQRDVILPSERGFAYKMKLEALKKQGKRNDLTCDQYGHKLNGKKSIEIIADELGESKTNVQRYIRLTYLIKELRDCVDNQIINDESIKKMALLPAVEISYLKEEEQYDFLDAMDYNDATPSHYQARIIRAKSEKGELDVDVLNDILSEKKENQKEHINWSEDKLRPYFPKGYTIKQMQDVIINFLEKYKCKWQNKNREDER